jgi:predicted  nucleic acid-binding Zn-ribbon protein
MAKKTIKSKKPAPTPAPSDPVAQDDPIAAEMAFAKHILRQQSTAGKGEIDRAVSAIRQGFASEKHWDDALDLLTRLPRDLVRDVWASLPEELRSERRKQILEGAKTARAEINIARAACFRGSDDEVTATLLAAALANWPPAEASKGKDPVPQALDEHFLGDERWTALVLPDSEAPEIANKLSSALMHSAAFRKNNRPKFLCEFAEWLGQILVQANIPVDQRRGRINRLISIPRCFEDHFKERVLVAAGLATPAKSLARANEDSDLSRHAPVPTHTASEIDAQSQAPALSDDSTLSSGSALGIVETKSEPQNDFEPPAAEVVVPREDEVDPESVDLPPQDPAVQAPPADETGDSDVREGVREADKAPASPPRKPSRSPRPSVPGVVKTPSDAVESAQGEATDTSHLLARARELANNVESEIQRRTNELYVMRDLADKLERAHQDALAARREAADLRNELKLKRGILESRDEEIEQLTVRIGDQDFDIARLQEDLEAREQEIAGEKDHFREAQERHEHQLRKQIDIRITELKGKLKSQLAPIFANYRSADLSVVAPTTIEFLQGRLREIEEELNGLGIEV